MRIQSPSFSQPSVRFSGEAGKIPATNHPGYNPRRDYQAMFKSLEPNGAVSYLPDQYWDPQLLKGLKILDLGAWDGALAQAFREKGIQAFALDLYHPEKDLKSLGAFVQATATQLPFANQSLDVIYSTCSLFTYPGWEMEAIYNKIAAMQEIERVLKPGGKFRVVPVDRKLMTEILRLGNCSSLSINTVEKIKDTSHWEGDDRNYFVEIVKS